MAFPMGFKSNPSDDDNRVSGSRPLAWCCDDLSGSKEPWSVFGDCEEKNKSTQRNVGKGFSSNKGQKTSIYGVRKGNAVNTRGFRFPFKKGHRNANSMNSSDFLLKEIILPEKYQDCVLKRKRGSGAERDDRGDELDDMMMEYSVCDFPIELPSAADDSSSTDEEWLLEQNGDDFALCVSNGTGDDDMTMEYSTGGDLPIDSPAAADSCSSLQEVVGITVEWLLEQVVGLAEDDRSDMPNLIVIDDDDDDECSNLVAAAPIDLSLEGKKRDTNVIVIDDDDDGECPILAAATPIDLSLEGIKGDTNLIVIDDDDDECPIIAAAAAAAAAPIDLSLEGKTFTEDFNFGFSSEDNTALNDHFAWDDDDIFGDYQYPWAGFCGLNFEPDQPSIFLGHTIT